MIKKFLQDESAATAVEYGLIAGVIGMVVAGAASWLAVSLDIMWIDNAETISNAMDVE